MPTPDNFSLTPPPADTQTALNLKSNPAIGNAGILPASGGTRPERRKKDSVRLVWDSKPKRPPSPRDIEFQTAEIVIPNPARDEAALPFEISNLKSEIPLLSSPQIDRSQMNRLIWGDNLLAMQAMLTQGYEGKIDLIYIDPPFDSKADYSHQLTVGSTSVTKEPSVIEQLAYRDTWEAGTDSYLDMIYPRLHLMKRLMSERGSIYVHMDYHCAHAVKLVLDEVFGRDRFLNEIVWQRTNAHNEAGQFGRIHDTIFFYSKTASYTFHPKAVGFSQKQLDRYHPDSKGRLFTTQDLCADRKGSDSGRFNWRGTMPPVGRGWGYTVEQLEEWYAAGRIACKRDGTPRMDGLIVYLDEKDGQDPQSIWSDVARVANTSPERLGFSTQKPEGMLERIVSASSDPNDLVADFFCGSGTTAAVAEKLGRRWITSDLGKVGIQVTRARLVQQDAKPFLIENIGNYQREMIYLTGGRIYEMQKIILKLYGATPHPNYPDLGIRAIPSEISPLKSEISNLKSAPPLNSELLTLNSNSVPPLNSELSALNSELSALNSELSALNSEMELVYVGYPDRPTTARKADELRTLAESLDGRGYKHLVLLAWDYDYNFNADWEHRILGTKAKVEVSFRVIPPDIYDYLKKAKNEDDIYRLAAQVQFHEKPFLKLAKPKISNLKSGEVEVTIAIDRYVLFDLPVDEKEQPKLRAAIKDNFALLIDYWAIDWSYDGTTFRSQWQALRGNGKRATVVPTSATRTFSKEELKAKSKPQIAIRVVDVFGNDATATLQLTP